MTAFRARSSIISRRFARAVIALIGAAASTVTLSGSSCDDSGSNNGPAEPNYTGALTVALAKPVDAVTPGVTGIMHVVITRPAGFTDVVQLTVADDRGYLHGPETYISKGQTSADFTLYVPSNTPLGTSTIQLIANPLCLLQSSCTGLVGVAIEVNVVINSPGTFTPSVQPPTIVVNPGTSYHVTTLFNRNQFTSSIDVTAAVIPGVNATVTKASDGNSADILYTFSSSLTADDVRRASVITATATGAAPQTTTLTYTVSALHYALGGAPPGIMTPGSKDTVVLKALRPFGIDAPITVSVTGPAGITVGGAVLPGRSQTGSTGSIDSIVVPITVAANVTPGVYTMTMHGVTDGQTDQTATFAVNVGSFSLSVSTAPITIQAGTSKLDTLTITPQNINDKFFLNQTAGVVQAFATDNYSAALIRPFTLSVAGTQAPGTYPVTIEGGVTVGGITIRTSTTFSVIVTPAPINNTSYTFCPSSGLPVWVAVEDGTSSFSNWKQVTSTTNQYVFTVLRGYGGIAWVVNVGGVSQLHFFFGTQDELVAQGANICAAPGNTKSVGASIANTGTAAKGYFSLGQAFRITTLPTTLIQWSNVAPGLQDIVATTVDGATPPSPIRMLLRRDVNATDGTFVTPALDFGSTSAEAFIAQQTTLTLNNTSGQSMNLIYQLHTANSFLSTYYSDGNSSTQTTRTAFGVPAAQELASDMHFISATANGSGNGVVPLRTAGIMTKTPSAPLALTFGSAVIAPSVNAEGYSFVVQPEYGKLYQMDFDQTSAASKLVTIQMTGAFVAASGDHAFIVPSFAGVGGWLPSYDLTPGLPTAWKFTASTWSGGGTTFPLFVDGTTFKSATAQGTTTP